MRDGQDEAAADIMARRRIHVSASVIHKAIDARNGWWLQNGAGAQGIVSVARHQSHGVGLRVERPHRGKKQDCSPAC